MSTIDRQLRSLRLWVYPVDELPEDHRLFRAVAHSVLTQSHGFNALTRIEFHHTHFDLNAFRDLQVAVADRGLHVVFSDCRTEHDVAEAILLSRRWRPVKFRSIGLRFSGSDCPSRPIVVCMLHCLSIVLAMDTTCIESIAIDVTPSLTEAVRDGFVAQVYNMTRLRRLAVSTWTMLAPEIEPDRTLSSLDTLCIGDRNVPPEAVSQFEGWWVDARRRFPVLTTYLGPPQLRVCVEKEREWYMDGLDSVTWGDKD